MTSPAAGRSPSAGRSVHLCGIAGTGMSALAGLFQQAGYNVSGSDVNVYPPVDQILEQMGITVHRGWSPDHIPADIDLCVIGNVISRGNPEAEHILNSKIPFQSMAEALYHHFIRPNHSVVVAGTHGKTSITTFIAYLLTSAGEKPGYFIGGRPLDLPANHQTARGSYFVSEGDEYESAFFDRSSKFLKYFPRYLVLSALEFDHVDFFHTRREYQRSFINLIDQVPQQGVLISNGDFPMNARVVAGAHAPVLTYGSGGGNDYVCRVERSGAGGSRFAVTGGGKTAAFRTPMFGEHNLLNLTAGIALADQLGVPTPAISRAVSSFRGVERRLRLIGGQKQTLIFEDFAHHPTAIQAVLSGCREAYPGHRLVIFFEPRSWSLRRNVFQQQLGSSLSLADEVVIKDVFQKEKIPPRQRLDTEELADELREKGVSVRVFYDYAGIREELENMDMTRRQVVLMVSNGDFGGLPAFAKTL